MLWLCTGMGRIVKKLPLSNHIIYNVDNLVDCLHILHNVMPAM